MKKLIGIVGAVLTACVAVPVLGAAAIFGGSGTTCYPQATSAPATPSFAAGTPASGYPTVAGWSPEQVGNAAAIITVGQQKGVPVYGWVIAVATAMQESGLRNLPGGDRDSVGLFQQRPSQGWGTPAELQDPVYAATKFYDRLLTVAGWQTKSVTDAAQSVQRSAFPDAYEKWADDATVMVTALTGLDVGCLATGPWTQPVHAPVGSGFRTADRPGHDGVDLIAARGTIIRAASAGRVIRVRCNAIDVRTGGDWGCDRDGDPMLTRGCGWYADLAHVDGVITRYCHMGRAPDVAVGNAVAAGQPIGVVGSTGHSSGPHLHYEVHLNHDEGPSGAVDPVHFMATHGASLGQSELRWLGQVADCQPR